MDTPRGKAVRAVAKEEGCKFLDAIVVTGKGAGADAMRYLIPEGQFGSVNKALLAEDFSVLDGLRAEVVAHSQV